MGVPLASTHDQARARGRQTRDPGQGPNVTAGYFNQPELTAEAFDEEGYYRSGDAVKLVDPHGSEQGPAVRRPDRRGLQAADRNVGDGGPLRTRLLSAAGVLTDAVICGHNSRTSVRSHGSTRPRRRGLRQRGSLDDPRLRDHLADSLPSPQPGGGLVAADRAAAAATEPPSLDAGEVTDKGYINQRACLRCRAATSHGFISNSPTQPPSPHPEGPETQTAPDESAPSDHSSGENRRAPRWQGSSVKGGDGGN